MLDALIVPLAMAIVFTTGGVAIQRLKRHAEHVTNVLGAALILFSFLDILVVFGRFADEAQSHMTQTAIRQAHVKQASSQRVVLPMVGVN
ncbi:hypothetical protein [Methylobacterium fujisawaense]|uniref:hypothetical protein n=1 Tax=Methylobacterium fujisawaense TaxID=107400 RepID=UPI00313EF7FB